MNSLMQLTRHFIAVLLCTMCVISGSTASAESTTGTEIRVLLTHGGHKFQQEHFFKMFDDLPGVTYTSVSLPQSAHLLTPELKNDYDVLVMYDMVTSIPASSQQTFKQLLQSGIGVVSLHHNLGAHMHWDEYSDIVGGKFFRRPQRHKDGMVPRSKFAHDQDYNVTVVDGGHPIVAGVTDFEIHDETYSQFYVSPDVHMLLTTEHPKADKAIAWTHRYGNSPVFYLLLGHDNQAWSHPAYPKLLLNGIRWAYQESRDKVPTAQ